MSRDRLRFAVAAGLGALGALSGVGLMAAAAWLISAAALHPPLLTLAVAIVGVRAFALARAALRYTERLASHDVAFRRLARTRVRMYGHLEPLAPAGLAAFRRGDLLTRLVADVDATADLALRVRHPVVVALVAGPAAVALVALLAPAAGAVLAIALLLAATGVPAVTLSAARQAGAARARARAERAGATVELLRARQVLAVYGAAEDRLRAVDDADAALTGTARRHGAAHGVAAALSECAVGAAVWGGLLAGVAALRTGALPGPALAVVVLVPIAAFEAVALLPTALLARDGVLASLRRLRAVAATAPPVAEPAAPRPLPPGMHRITLRGVGACWPGGQADALRGVDVDLPPGRRIAVVGESGAGKSTLAAVLARFVDVTAGTYALDGHDVRGFAGDDVRRVVGCCAQDAHVFDSTIRANLLLARPGASEDQLRAALDAARLREFVDALPAGLDTPVGERGGRLSAGQHRRLVLARFLLAQHPVLVLDEPAANLDSATADALTLDLLAATTGRTTVLITHRLTGLDAVDEILVLERGRVAERGTHADLLAAGGRYAALSLREQ